MTLAPSHCVQVGEANAELQKVTDLMGEITHRGQSVNIKGELNPTNLLPGTYTNRHPKRHAERNYSQQYLIEPRALLQPSPATGPTWAL